MADTQVIDLVIEDQFQATLDALRQEAEQRVQEIEALKAELDANAKKDARQQVYIWMSSLRGVLIVVAHSEKEARKLAIERDPIYQRWFLSVRPQVISKVVGAEVFTFAGGRRS